MTRRLIGNVIESREYIYELDECRMLRQLRQPRELPRTREILHRENQRLLLPAHAVIRYPVRVGIASRKIG